MSPKIARLVDEAVLCAQPITISHVAVQVHIRFDKTKQAPFATLATGH